MDWFSTWEFVPDPIAYAELEPADSAGGVALMIPIVWLVLAAIALAVTVIGQRGRVVRRSFRCAIANREVEARLRSGRVQSCSAFEDPTAITCGRRCVDRSFRMQWPPPLPPVLMRPSTGRPGPTRPWEGI
jgi:hypothetical protein